MFEFSESTMAKKHPPYAPEFRRQMIELVRAGRTPEELAKEFEPSAQAIRNWVAQADRDEGRREDGLTTAEREELNRLRRENRQLKLERSSGNGPDRCGMWGLRAPARCSTVPRGTSKGRNQGGRLKLKMVRKKQGRSTFPRERQSKATSYKEKRQHPSRVIKRQRNGTQKSFIQPKGRSLPNTPTDSCLIQADCTC